MELGIHNLTLEDIVTIDQVPKFEDHEHYFFIVLKMIYWNDGTNDVEVEQVSLLLLRNIVISFQEKPGDVFNPCVKGCDAAWDASVKNSPITSSIR